MVNWKEWHFIYGRSLTKIPTRFCLENDWFRLFIAILDKWHISTGYLDKECSQSLSKSPVKICHLSRIAMNNWNYSRLWDRNLPEFACVEKCVEKARMGIDCFTGIHEKSQQKAGEVQTRRFAYENRSKLVGGYFLRSSVMVIAEYRPKAEGMQIKVDAHKFTFVSC